MSQIEGYIDVLSCCEGYNLLLWQLGIAIDKMKCSNSISLGHPYSKR